MNKKAPSKVTTITMPPDIREILDVWTRENLTSMSSEIIRCIRDRAQREQREAAAA